jgi:uncharacterized membrane protein YdbT with pleckstrin-like domain
MHPMGYPQKLLADDEKIVYEMRPHWRALVVPVIVFLVTLGLGTYVLAKLASNDAGWVTGVRWIVVIIMVAALLWWVVRPFAYWYTTLYVITNRRLIVRYGLVARNGRDMPLSRVNDVSFHHTVLDQMLNCGTLIVESAGEKGQLEMRAIPDVENLQREVYRLHDEDDIRRRRSAEGTPPPAAPPENPAT